MDRTVEELVRRKEFPGEDASIFERSLNLSKREIELCDSFGSLKERELGSYMHETRLIPGRVICYVTEGYDGDYIGWNFPSNKRAKNYILKKLNLGSFPQGIEQARNIQTLAELVAEDFKRLSGRTLSAQGKTCEPECSATNSIHPLTSGFCGVSLEVERKGTILYNLIRAYAVNLKEGV